MNDVTISKNESVWSEDEARAGTPASALLAYLNMYHRGTDALYRAYDRTRISVQQSKVRIRCEIALRLQRGGGNILRKPIYGSHGMWMLMAASSIPGCQRSLPIC